MKNVIIDADDLGISKGTNQAIREAHENGILTSASLMVNMPAYEDALVNIIPALPGLGIGIHLSLTIGRSVLQKEKIPLLVNENGYFKNSFLQLFRLAKNNPEARSQIYDELEAQFQKGFSSKIGLDHINSQHHVHMIPPIFDVVVDLANKYNCHRLRITDESFAFGGKLNLDYFLSPLLSGSILKKLLLSKFGSRNRKRLVETKIRTTNYFFGIIHTSNMNKGITEFTLDAVKEGVTEILTHPGFYSKSAPQELRCNELEGFLLSKNRRIEFEALVDNQVQNAISNNNIKLIRFADF